MVKVISVRLADEVYQELVSRSERTGIAPAVLARAYIKESLNSSRDLPAVASEVALPPRPRTAKKQQTKGTTSKPMMTLEEQTIALEASRMIGEEPLSSIEKIQLPGSSSRSSRRAKKRKGKR